MNPITIKDLQTAEFDNKKFQLLFEKKSKDIRTDTTPSFAVSPTFTNETVKLGSYLNGMYEVKRNSLLLYRGFDKDLAIKIYNEQ